MTHPSIDAQPGLFDPPPPAVYRTGWLRCTSCRVTWQTISTPTDAGRACPMCCHEDNVINAPVEEGR